MANVRLGVHDLQFLSLRARLFIAIPALALIALAFWVAAQFLRPIPPRVVVVAAGPTGGLLHRAAGQFHDALAREGIRVDVRATQGTGENLRLLLDSASGVDVGFVLAGTAGMDVRGLVNVSNLAHVALWGLGRRDAEIRTLTQLQGKRVAVGPLESGLWLTLAPLMAANGVTPQNSTILHLPDPEALARFAAGEIDVVFSPEGGLSPAFVEVAARPDAAIIDFTRAAAYAHRFPHVVRLDLPAGSVDFIRNVPPADTKLMGTTLMLVARDDLHPTVVDLLVDASRHASDLAGPLASRGQFPNLGRADAIPVSDQAVLYQRSGPTFLRRYLPLWLADFLQRVVTLALPVVAVVLPLVHFIPAVVANLLAARLDRCYLDLRRLEREAEAGARARADVLRDIDELAARVRAMAMPASYSGALFALRQHIGLVRAALAAPAGEGG